MWKDIKIDNVGAIEKCVGEYQIWMQEVLPYGKFKVKIYENQDNLFYGYSDVRIIRKFDSTSEGAVGHGTTAEQALEDTIKCFLSISEEDYPNGLREDNVEYSNYSDF